jgi:hypothetical protein
MSPRDTEEKESHASTIVASFVNITKRNSVIYYSTLRILIVYAVHF